MEVDSAAVDCERLGIFPDLSGAACKAKVNEREFVILCTLVLQIKCMGESGSMMCVAHGFHCHRGSYCICPSGRRPCLVGANMKHSVRAIAFVLLPSLQTVKHDANYQLPLLYCCVMLCHVGIHCTQRTSPCFG